MATSAARGRRMSGAFVPHLPADGPRRVRTMRVRALPWEALEQQPLQWRLILRLFQYTRAHAAKRNWLLLTVALRSLQLPALAWLAAAIIAGPVAASDMAGVARGALAF